MHKDYKKRPSAADLLTHIFLEPRDTERQQSLMLLDTDVREVHVIFLIALNKLKQLL